MKILMYFYSENAPKNRIKINFKRNIFNIKKSQIK